MHTRSARVDSWSTGLALGGLFVSALAVLGLAACAGGGENIRRGDQLMAAGLHEEALAEYEEARRSSPENAELLVKIAETRRRLAAALQDSARGLVESGDRLGAIQTLKKALEYDEDGRSIEGDLRKVASQEMELARKAQAESRWEDALKIYDRLLEELPRLALASQGRDQVREAWAGSLLKEARDFELRGLEANALISVLKARQVAGDAAGGAADMETALRGRLRKESVFGYAVAPGKPKARWVAGTARLVGMLERAEVADCPAAVASGAAAAKLTLRLELDGLSFSKQQREDSAQQKYQSGTRPVDNPAFHELEEQIEKKRAEAKELEGKISEAEGVVEQLRKVFEDAGPDDDEDSLRSKLKAAERELEVLRTSLRDLQALQVELRNKLSNTPRMLDEPVYDEHRYAVLEVTRTATARVKATGRAEGGQVVMRGEEFEGTAATEDKTWKAAKKYGLAGDPLAFPKGDAELEEAALEDAAGKLAKRIGALCVESKREVLERARQAAAESPLEAVEDFALYAILVDGEPPADLLSHLRSTRAFDDLQALRGKGARKQGLPSPDPKPSPKGEPEGGDGLTLE
ncbi:MAG TPA: hypothetical protein PK668_00065 [Myxococcota bacterium]|nr:hypothetical protein [Myxococcota bacterium]HRY95774.1 hypothetical protein [Myxococcota bacterium]HSA20529.1 hypothetical protein [Myxococcota bacterium]